MNEATLVTTFLIVFREALEASLIVGIILTVLSRLGEIRYFPHVIGSSLAAILASFLAGGVLMSLTSQAQGRMEELIEGVISIAACGVLTYMIFWMDRQARNIKPDIETKVERALDQKELLAIILLPFLAVFREGAETVLFLSAVASQNSGAVSFWGGTLGLLFAVAIVLAIFAGGKRVPLKPLFQGSGIFLLLVAAGLLAYGIHELEEFGLIPEIVSPVWNINHILNEKKGMGSFLKALFGYNGNPSLTEVLAYGSYLIGVFFLLQRRKPVLVTAGSSNE